MSELEIKNIGPIKYVKFNINKINVFIGPQSSGKSTIAKLISFCEWIEKDIVAHQNKDYISAEFLNVNLYGFHKMKSYFNETSYIKYTSDAICFEFTSLTDFKIELLENFKNAQIGKVAYVPSERNIVSVPNISSFPMEENYIRNYIFDWLNIKRKFDAENSISLKELNIKFYFDENTQKDSILLDNGTVISIDEASSGVQSVIPLYVFINYYTKWIYDHIEDVSYDKNLVIQESVIKKTGLVKPEDENVFLKNPEFIARISKIISQIAGMSENVNMDGLNNSASEIFNKISKLCKPHFSNLIIEEPELNLFPKTQIELVYDILKMINKDRDSISITTHSQYILYALNNSMMAYLVKDKMPKDIYSKMSLYECEVDPNKVSVFEIENGGFRGDETIQEENGLIGENYFDESMKNIMDDYYTMLDYYGD